MKIYYTILFTVVVIITFLIKSNIESLDNDDVSILPRYSKHEFVLTYIGNSTCTYCQNPELIDQISKLDKGLFEIVNDLEFSYKKIGISTDWDLDSGYNYLKSVLEFNELVVGNGWSNLGALRYIYTDFKGVPATPQIIISFRRFNEITLNTTAYRGINEEKIILNMVGLHELDNMDNERLTAIIKNSISEVERYDRESINPDI